jgi:hypothetical protein
MLLADLMIFCTLGTIGPTNFKNSESRLFERKCGADLSWYRTFLLPNCLFQRCWNVFNSAFIKSRYLVLLPGYGSVWYRQKKNIIYKNLVQYII